MVHFVVNNILTETETISGTSFKRKNILLIELLRHTTMKAFLSTTNLTFINDESIH